MFMESFEENNLLLRRYVPATKNLEMRSEVNVRLKVTLNGMHHSAIPRGIHTPNLGFMLFLSCFVMLSRTSVC